MTKDQATSPLKPKRLSRTSFVIINREPNILSLTRTQLKADSAQIQEELVPLESEIEQLKRFQEELKGQIMSSRIIERQLSMKTFEALETAHESLSERQIMIKNEENSDALEHLKNLRKALELLEVDDNQNQETEVKSSNEGQIISLKDMERMLMRKTPKFSMEEVKINNEDMEINELLENLQGIEKKENLAHSHQNLFKKKRPEIENFDKKWQVIENDESVKRASPKKEKDRSFNKEKIDELSEEIQELLEMQHRKIEKKGGKWVTLSEIKEASMEESTNEAI